MKYEIRKFISKVGERGQVTIPKSLRMRYGVRPGQEVPFEERDDGLFIRKVAPDEPLRALVGRVRDELDVDRYLDEARGSAWSEELDAG